MRTRGSATERLAATALIADRDTAFRGIVRGAIDGLVRIVGETDNGDSALVLARALKPDVILIELDLPRGGGIATAWRIKRDQPEVRVILMTANGEEAFLESTGKAWPDAFLRRQDARNDAPTVLRRVAAGNLRPWDRRR